MGGRSLRSNNGSRQTVMGHRDNTNWQTTGYARELIGPGSLLRVRDVASDSMLVTLHYNDSTINRNNAGNPYCSWRYRMNSVYDPDPSLGTGAISGFNEYAAIYSTYRVLAFRYQIIVANDETFAVQLYTCSTTADVGLNSANTPDFGEIKGSRTALLSGKGGQDRVKMIGSVDLPKFFGASYLYDSTFNAAVTGNPATILYHNVGFYAGSTNLVSGVTIAVKLSFDVLFYRRQNIFS